VLRSFFDEAQRIARYETVCYANCNIVLMEDFAAAVEKAAAANREFLLVGRRWDTDITEAIAFQEMGWREQLREMARASGAAQRGLDRLFRISQGLLFRDASGIGDRAGILGPVASVERAGSRSGGGGCFGSSDGDPPES